MTNLTPYRDAPLEDPRPVWEGKHICAKCVHYTPETYTCKDDLQRHCCKRTKTTHLNVVTGEKTETWRSCELENKRGKCPHFTTPEGHLLILPVPVEELTIWQLLYFWWYWPSYPKRPQTPHP